MKPSNFEIKMTPTNQRVKVNSNRIQLGGGIERFDVTDHIDAINNHGLLVEIENGHSQHLR